VGGGIEHLVLSGPLLLAVPVALAAGAVTFISPCCLPLVPGYLSYVAGMSGADTERAAVAGTAVQSRPGGPAATTAAAAASGGGQALVTVTAAPAGSGAATPAAAVRGRTVAGTTLFVLGFSVLFAS
jgi:cytochrome c-type biogenesis protein